MRLTSLRSIALAVLIAVAASGCVGGPVQTFQYRAIQADFMEAARADNVAGVDPLSASTVGATYPQIVDQLTPERIRDLDPRLHANAWVIRSYSQWRAAALGGPAGKQLTLDAVQSAQAGLQASGLQAGSRDQVLLTLLPALAIELEIAADWEADARTLTPDRYADAFAPRFGTAVTRLDAARLAASDATPADTRYYVAYQRWRIVHNWNRIIESISGPDGAATRTVRISARQSALAKLGAPAGMSMADHAAKISNDIPADHPLRSLIAAQGG